MIKKIWHLIPNDFMYIHLNEYGTMTNHNHRIIDNAPGMDIAGTDIDGFKTGAHVGVPLRGHPIATIPFTIHQQELLTT